MHVTHLEQCQTYKNLRCVSWFYTFKAVSCCFHPVVLVLVGQGNSWTALSSHLWPFWWIAVTFTCPCGWRHFCGLWRSGLSLSPKNAASGFWAVLFPHGHLLRITRNLKNRVLTLLVSVVIGNLGWHILGVCADSSYFLFPWPSASSHWPLTYLLAVCGPFSSVLDAGEAQRTPHPVSVAWGFHRLSRAGALT